MKVASYITQADVVESLTDYAVRLVALQSTYFDCISKIMLERMNCFTECLPGIFLQMHIKRKAHAGRIKVTQWNDDNDIQCKLHAYPFLSKN